MAITPKLAAIASTVALGLLFASFSTVSLADPPTPEKSPITGFPTWHEVYPHEVKEVTFAFTLLALVFSSGALYAAHRSVRPPSRSLTQFVPYGKAAAVSATQINQFIYFYIVATWMAVVAYLIFDVGASWAVIGALHNMTEMTLLLLIQFGGRVHSLSFALYVFVYVTVTIIGSVYFPWPMNALFFKWQGLCSDFGLVLVFTRLWWQTRQTYKENPHLEEQESLLDNPHPAEEILGHPHHSTPISSRHGLGVVNALFHHDHPTRHTTTTTTTTTNNNGESSSSTATSPRFPAGEHVDDLHHPNNNRFSLATRVNYDVYPSDGLTEPGIWGVQWKNPDQIWLLIVAALVHVLGNCATTIWVTSTYAMASFHISYGISYPLYAYYLYVDNHAMEHQRIKVYLPDMSKIKTFTSLIVVVFGATLTIRGGLLVAAKAAEGGSIMF